MFSDQPLTTATGHVGEAGVTAGIADDARSLGALDRRPPLLGRRKPLGKASDDSNPNLRDTGPVVELPDR
jgi:hypothetical protein